jgi:hypothetical protein
MEFVNNKTILRQLMKHFFVIVVEEGIVCS